MSPPPRKIIAPAPYRWTVTCSAIRASSFSDRSLKSGSLRSVITRADLIAASESYDTR